MIEVVEPIVDGNLLAEAQTSEVYGLVLPITDDSVGIGDSVQDAFTALVEAHPSSSTAEQFSLLGQRFNASVLLLRRTNEQEPMPAKEEPDATT